MDKPILWIATGNVMKVKEFTNAFPEYDVKTTFDIPGFEDIEEDGSTYEENAMIKAKALAIYTNGVAIGDDTGIEVEGLNNFPGIYSKRWAYPETNFANICQMLLDKLEQSENPLNRNARMVSCLAIYDARTNKGRTILMKTNGVLAHEVYAINGYGYDEVFIPNGHDKTYSELGPKIKSLSAPRNKAVNELKSILIEYNK